MLISVNSGNSTLAFVKAACHANPGDERTFTRSSL